MLYYMLSDDGAVCYESETKALVEARAVRAELNNDALADCAANCALAESHQLR
jgi:hypothetical protein